MLLADHDFEEMYAPQIQIHITSSKELKDEGQGIFCQIYLKKVDTNQEQANFQSSETGDQHTDFIDRKNQPKMQNKTNQLTLQNSNLLHV